MNKQAILVLDIQEDFTGDRARMPVSPDQAASMIDHLNQLIDRMQGSGTEIVYIGNEFSKWDPGNLFRNFAAIQGQPGTQMDKRLHVVNDHYFPKHRGDAFSNPDLGSYLKSKNIEEIFIAGLYSEACVTASVRGALRAGFRARVLTDCIASGSERSKERSIARFRKMDVPCDGSASLVPDSVI